MNKDMELEKYGHQLVKLSQKIPFSCKMCGNCCRNVKNSVLLESQDAFRLAKYFRSIGNPIQTIQEILVTYAVMVPLTAVGYPIFTLKTEGPEHACIFLQENRCSIQPAKTQTCRLYPFSAGPGENSHAFIYTRCLQNAHHYCGEKISVNDWVHENFSKEDREFTRAEFDYAPELGRLLHRLRGLDECSVLEPVIYYKYLNFDLDQPFLPQFHRNQMRLVKVLKDMTK